MKKEYYEKIIEELIKLIDEGVYIVDKRGVGRFYNDVMASMEKVNMEDVLGKKFHDAFPEMRKNDSTRECCRWCACQPGAGEGIGN